MSVKWIKTKVKGVRYYEHGMRRHGVCKDRYFTIRYRLDGKVKEEALGWASNGWTEQRAATTLYELKEHQRIGLGEVTLAEKRKNADKKRKIEEATKLRQEKGQITFSSIFVQYIDQAYRDKSAQTFKTEKGLFDKWVNPILGNLPMKDISLSTLEKLKKNMKDAGRAPRTITYALAIVRQAFNYARNIDLYHGDNPVSKVKKPSRDNRRARFLKHEEADSLLWELAKISLMTHDISLISLHCGLRAGEIFNLVWNDIDFENKIILIKDTKSGRNRNVIMTEDAKTMLKKRKSLSKSALVFSSRTGEKITEVSRTFDRVIAALGFNDGVTDPRHKVVFHTLRHTYASWLVMSGADLYTVQRLMGHSTIAMTERYSHLAPDHLKKVISTFEDNIKRRRDNNLVKLDEIAKK